MFSKVFCPQGGVCLPGVGAVNAGIHSPYTPRQADTLQADTLCPVHAGIHTTPPPPGRQTPFLRRHPARQTHPSSRHTLWTDTPPGWHLLGRHPHSPGQTPLPAVTAADGMHPTGLHSCFLFKMHINSNMVNSKFHQFKVNLTVV